MIEYDPHRWWDHFFDVKGSMLREIIARVLFVVVVACIAVGLRRAGFEVSFSDKLHALIGLALGLLLVFRTNSSYDRFWEGRKLWGAIVNETRNIGRAATAYVADPAAAARLVRWTMAFPYATMHSLRGGRGLGPVADELPKEEAEAVLAADHVPLAVSIRMSLEVARARAAGSIASDMVQVALDRNVQLLIDYMGACERIRKTPLPFAYVVHLRRAVVLYCLTLPFALLETYGMGTIPVSFLVAFVLLGVEEIGVEIEDPFGGDDNDLPLKRLCGTIEKNLREVLARLPAAGGAAPPAAAVAEAQPPQTHAKQRN